MRFKDKHLQVLAFPLFYRCEEKNLQLSESHLGGISITPLFYLCEVKGIKGGKYIMKRFKWFNALV